MSGHQRNDLWQLYDTRNFADLWYGARSAGERLRALTLERLYRNRPHPGGPHPDPREPAAFSSQAVLSVASYLVGLQLDASYAGATGGRGSAGSEAPHSADYDADYDEETGERLPYAWLMTYATDATDAQNDPTQDTRPPQIIIRSLHTSRFMLEFEIACLVGYWHRDHARLGDPDAPTGAILLPDDPTIITILHQYAIALLGLRRDCPESWTCHCNRIRRRFNAPPPDHTQPTGQLTLAELLAEAEQARAARRERRNTEPQFPYPDPNRWTQEE
ncbi:MAG TPA: hypothetical protein VFU63_13555 [Ktedonobacterales bacterium]|nr:hypothetical protein [Ktedonobacterales bacterium]